MIILVTYTITGSTTSFFDYGAIYYDDTATVDLPSPYCPLTYTSYWKRKGTPFYKGNTLSYPSNTYRYYIFRPIATESFGSKTSITIKFTVGTQWSQYNNRQSSEGFTIFGGNDGDDKVTILFYTPTGAAVSNYWTRVGGENLFTLPANFSAYKWVFVSFTTTQHTDASNVSTLDEAIFYI